jgi:uncharacterized protein DUF929
VVIMPAPKTSTRRPAAPPLRPPRRNRWLLAGTPIAVVIIAVGLLVAVKLGAGSGPKSGARAEAAAAGVVQAVTGVPASALDAVGAGTSTQLPSAIDGPALTADGKPRVLYVGAEYCPFCAAERWPMIVALSRFGAWQGLGQTTSAGAPEVYPGTATLTFHGATYRSELLSFTGVETESNQVVNGRYGQLDTLSDADAAVLRAHDPSGGIPFVDLGGKWAITGATYAPAVLAGKSHAQIAAALAEPGSDVARGVNGAANVITAALCELTGGQPAAVCTSPGVRTAAGALAGAADAG